MYIKTFDGEDSLSQSNPMICTKKISMLLQNLNVNIFHEKSHIYDVKKMSP